MVMNMLENIGSMRQKPIKHGKLTALIISAAALCGAVCFFCGIKAVPAVTNSADAGIRLPIIMYHSVLKDESKSGAYVITPWQLEYDLKYLKENGYNTVFMKEVIDYVYEGKPLPRNPVVITFDDGCYNNKEYGLPLLEKYDSKAVISIVGAYTDFFTEQPDENPNYAYLSWQNVRELIDSGRVEIQNHSNDMHKMEKGRKGCCKKQGETMEQYMRVLSTDLETMQRKCMQNLDYVPQVFTYPYGSISPESAPVVKEAGFSASLSCVEGINVLTGDKDELYMMKRCIRTDKRDVASILDWLKKK